MWPAIWPLAIADLGKFTKTGASLLVMGIVGGAVLPLIFGFTIDAIKTTEVASVCRLSKCLLDFYSCLFVHLVFRYAWM